MTDSLDNQSIAQLAHAAGLVIFMKGTPQETSCSYSSRVVKILEHIGAEYKSHNVLNGDDLRKRIKAFTGVKTLPQIFLDGEYLGGSDTLKALYEDEDLRPLLHSRNIQTHSAELRPKLDLAEVTFEDVKSCGRASAPARLGQ